MVIARLADLFTTGDSAATLLHDSRSNGASTAQNMELPTADPVPRAVEENVDHEAARPPYLHVRMPTTGPQRR